MPPETPAEDPNLPLKLRILKECGVPEPEQSLAARPWLSRALEEYARARSGDFLKEFLPKKRNAQVPPMADKSPAGMMEWADAWAGIGFDSAIDETLSNHEAIMSVWKPEP